MHKNNISKQLDKHANSFYLQPIELKYSRKNSTKQNSTWTIEGVTYQRINAPNLSNNDGLSKEIEKSRWRAARM
jgi:hypothetical protein